MTLAREFDDDGAPLPPVGVPPGDFEDARPGVAGDATVWGDAPPQRLEPVGDVLDTVLGRFADPERTRLEEVLAAWDRLAGQAWSKATPVRVEGETLTVEVASGLHATQLQFDVTRVVAGLRDLAGGSIRRIRFRVART